jgi:hypothetical protein
MCAAQRAWDKKGSKMAKVQSAYVTADEVAGYCGVSKSMAYKIIHQMNDDLKSKGYFTISGRVPRSYFNEKIHGRE